MKKIKVTQHEIQQAMAGNVHRNKKKYFRKLKHKAMPHRDDSLYDGHSPLTRVQVRILSLPLLILKLNIMKWKTKDGIEMDVKHMDPVHAQNVINLIIKNSSSNTVLSAILYGVEQAKKKVNDKAFTLNGEIAQAMVDEGTMSDIDPCIWSPP